MDSGIREKILEELKRSMPEYVSGEVLSEKLGVSRTAVWKHIKELKDLGYPMESSSRKGYRLMDYGDALNAYEICSSLETRILGRNVKYLDEVDSTNTYGKLLALEGCADGTVIVADIQRAGKGRLGRSWMSEGGKGIWMSVVLRPSIRPEEVQIITLAASIAVVRAVEALYGLRAGIKWPNDILLGTGKACGILTEMNAEMERVNFVILGMGINVSHGAEDFPEELRERATSLKLHMEGAGEKTISRSQIIAKVLSELESMYCQINDSYETALKSIISQWKKYSVTLGRRVKVTIRNNEFIGTAEDITEDGKLIVACEDGVRREVLSGEVSVRGLLGYI